MRFYHVLGLLLLPLMCGCSWLVPIRFENESDDAVQITVRQSLHVSPEVPKYEPRFDKSFVLAAHSAKEISAWKNSGPRSFMIVAQAPGWRVERDFVREQYPPELRSTSAWGTPHCHIHISRSGIELHRPTWLDRTKTFGGQALTVLVLISPLLILVGLVFLLRARLRRPFAGSGS